MGILDFLYANPVQFANELGLYALLSIIPLIIIYLLRPRPMKLRIPSLMFLFELEKRRRLNIFRKFLKDPLFLIQLLVLALVSIAVAAPFIMATEEKGGGHTVIVLDASASMQADGKFDRAVEEADKFLSARNTVILAESVPVMVVREVPSGTASDALGELKAKATEADLSSAILLGKRMLPEGGRIAVFSDFASFSGDDPLTARGLAQASGIDVEFVKMTGRTDNTGIVNGWFEGSDFKIVVKNFNSDAKNVRMDVTTNNQNVLSTTLSLKGQSSEFFSVRDLGEGVTKISLDTGDALSVDDSAYVIIPRAMRQNILYITDNERSPSLVALRLLPQKTVRTVGTGSIPSLADYSIVFVNSAISQEAAQSLSDYVERGGNAVIITSPDLKQLDLLPVELDGIANRTSLIVVQQTRITEGIDVGKIDVKKHFKARLKGGGVPLIEGGDRSVILAYWNLGRGRVIYSGIADPAGGNIYDPLNENVWNDFHSKPEYPLFWKQLLEWISGSVDVSEYNARTGMFVKLPAVQSVKTPSSSLTTGLLLLDEVGVYELPDKDIAVNLFNEKESNLAASAFEIPQRGETEPTSALQTIPKRKHLDVYLIMAAVFFVFLELYYLRWRGEL